MAICRIAGVSAGSQSAGKKPIPRAPPATDSQLSARQYRLDYQDYLDIRNSPLVRNATPVLYRGDLRLVSEYVSSNGYVDGSEPQFYDIRYQPVDQGRWLNWSDEREGNRVCVIGHEFVRILFPGRPVVGSRLLINGVPFQVIGTMPKIGHGNNADQNMRLVMPYTTMAQACSPAMSSSPMQAVP